MYMLNKTTWHVYDMFNACKPFFFVVVIKSKKPLTCLKKIILQISFFDTTHYVFVNQ